MNYKSKKGFTLVEIMIVVVIIGLLAAMAIPAFQKVRENSIRSRMDNDARQLASAAQQYFLENNQSTVTVGYTATDGEVTGLSGFLNAIGRGYEKVITGATGGTMETDQNFEMGHGLLESDRRYNPEGQFLEDVTP